MKINDVLIKNNEGKIFRIRNWDRHEYYVVEEMGDGMYDLVNCQTNEYISDILCLSEILEVDFEDMSIKHM